MPFALVPFLLLVIPIVEIATFIAIGGQIGIGLTLLMILVTAIIGSILLRVQGLGLIREIQTKFADGQVPGRALGNGAMIVVAGILLLTPGFVTDAIGFLLFVPPIRSAIFAFISSRVKVVGPGGANFGADPFAHQRTDRPGQGTDTGGPTIDLDEDQFSSEPSRPNPDSPWNPGSSKK
ncbi:MAG: membrane protein FxsA [Rhizobiaceae bacterium]|nr:membrane protein FxsA [Hyphomicrobiales bacterium]NRB32920.1 membrane protein FxsA [Rhizobiaceae bacterium]